MQAKVGDKEEAGSGGVSRGVPREGEAAAAPTKIQRTVQGEYGTEGAQAGAGDGSSAVPAGGGGQGEHGQRLVLCAGGHHHTQVCAHRHPLAIPAQGAGCGAGHTHKVGQVHMGRGDWRGEGDVLGW